MADVPHRQTAPHAQPGGALDRIDRAIARIKAATTARNASSAVLAHRHAALRTCMAEAIAVLDSVIDPSPVIDARPRDGLGDEGGS